MAPTDPPAPRDPVPTGKSTGKSTDNPVDKTGPTGKHGALDGGDPYLPGSGNGGYTVRGYDLDLDYRVRTNRLEGTAIITAAATQKLSRFSLDLVGLVASKVSVNGTRVAKFSQSAGKLVIRPATPLAAGQGFSVMIRYAGFPHPAVSAWGEVGWEELTDGVLVAGQPNGASTWFPCDDRPGAKAPMQTRITCDSPYRVAGTGALTARAAHGSRTTWTFSATEPVAPYLASVQIGVYDERVISPGPVPQRVLFPGNMLASITHDLVDHPKMVDVFSELFGPYPFANYVIVVTDDVLEIPLEAHGLAVFGRNHIDGNGGSERLIAHELAHQWFGNSVTASAWQHIWLHEGFACYAEWLWSESQGTNLAASGGDPAFRRARPINARTADEHARHHWSRLDASPQDLLLADPGPKLMFDDRVYKRGALTLHALRLTVGDETFFAILRGWAARHRHGTVTTAGFVDHAQALSQEMSQVDVGPLLALWLNNTALPPLPERPAR